MERCMKKIVYKTPNMAVFANSNALVQNFSQFFLYSAVEIIMFLSFAYDGPCGSHIRMQVN